MPGPFDDYGNYLDDPADVHQYDKRASPAFRRAFRGAFWIAALIGLLLGVLWTIAGWWHFHVARLF